MYGETRFWKTFFSTFPQANSELNIFFTFLVLLNRNE
jgi:hypothetical protein